MPSSGCQILMNKMKKYFWFTIFCVVSYGLYWVWNSMDFVENIKIKYNLENPIVIQNPIINSFKKNYRNIHLIAKKAELFQSQNISHLYIVEGEVFSTKKEQPTSWFKAKMGILNQNKKTLVLQNDVMIELQDGKKIVSKELTYNALTGIISTNSDVTITDIDTSIILGSAMEYDTNKDRLQISNPKMFLIIN